MLKPAECLAQNTSASIVKSQLLLKLPLLEQALDAAEAKFGSRSHAVDADLSLEGRRLNEEYVFEVDVMKNAYTTAEGDVDAETGEIKRPGWDADWDDIFDNDDDRWDNDDDNDDDDDDRWEDFFDRD